MTGAPPVRAMRFSTASARELNTIEVPSGENAGCSAPVLVPGIALAVASAIGRMYNRPSAT